MYLEDNKVCLKVCWNKNIIFCIQYWYLNSQSHIQCTVAQWNLKQIAHKQLYRADIREYELYLGKNNTLAVFFQHFYFFSLFSSIQLFPNFSLEALT